MFAFCRLIAWTLSAVALIPSADGRFLLKRNPNGDSRQPVPSCHTNVECIQQGLPVLEPNPKARAAIPRREVWDLTQTCGAGRFVGFPDGKYRITIAGAQGGGPSNSGAVAGLGAVVDTNITVSTGNVGILFSYYIGCAGRLESRWGSVGGGGGGGGSFFWVTPPGKYPQDGADISSVLLVAGGGGGAGYFMGNGTPGGTNPTAVQTADGGTGGGALGGGGGAGYQTKGTDSNAPGAVLGGWGGSQSPSYGGTFKGGNSGAGGNPSGQTGGDGGGGGASVAGGGGGGGFHGGNGGLQKDAGRLGEGGRGGSSYANPQTDPQWRITAISAVATQVGSGSIRVERY
ncbi:uncharacterized protein MKK02DRAFT_41495 [Dioszegia hungarica]|uniref:Uncharacterized protein n=1 Tax=Dioszegia hungarica TaxID=4972 RepID=A0AA38H2P4_9TREE|nr:uncharacterized protein MKK02DRAFT_41495 [Dioszegia hungarica]KAI9631864.1 hypothetical protein MKK02DRAFT_41495 [Dioszegia hungarica]